MQQFYSLADGNDVAVASVTFLAGSHAAAVDYLKLTKPASYQQVVERLGLRR